LSFFVEEMWHLNSPELNPLILHVWEIGLSQAQSKTEDMLQMTVLTQGTLDS